MKIGEIIELTKNKPLSKIAKEQLNIGEKSTREALKKAGCYSVSGKRGWFFDGEPNILEKSIYDFTSTKIKTNETTKTQKNEQTKDTNNKTEKVSNNNTKETNNRRKRASFDIDIELLKKLKIQAVIEEKNLYDLVEQAIKEFLNKK